MPRRYHHGDLPGALRRAALEQVEQGSIASVSMARAARAAGVSSGAPYQHYRDRDDLLADVAREAMDGMTERFADVAASWADPREQLAELVVAYVRFSLDDPARFRVLHAFAPRVMDDPARAASADANVAAFASAARRVAGGAAAPAVTASMFAIALGFSELGVTTGAPQRLGVSSDQLLERARAVAVAALEEFALP